MEDVCSHEDVSMQCRALADYAIACAKLGVVLGDWRLKITECGKPYKIVGLEYRMQDCKWSTHTF